MAITVFDVNTKTERRQAVENLKHEFTAIFSCVKEAEICIVCDFPAIGSSYEKSDYLIFINIPDYQGIIIVIEKKETGSIYIAS